MYYLDLKNKFFPQIFYKSVKLILYYQINDCFTSKMNQKMDLKNQFFPQNLTNYDLKTKLLTHF